MANLKAAKSDNGKTAKSELTQEQKSTNFKVAGSKRTTRVLKALRSLSTVARPSRYAWTPADVNKILSAIAQEVQAVEARFQNPGRRSKDDFSL